MAKKNKVIEVQGTEITIYSHVKDEYISVTDIARFKDPKRTDYIIQNWMKNRNTIEFLGIWERLNNPDFKPIEFDGFRNQAGLNSFILTPKQWIEKSQQDVGQISSHALLQSEKPIAKQAAAQFETKVRQQAVAQLTQIPWGYN
ncbi:MAG: KilA-N domain-containing protein [ANME-2 cluster archaeon]|nr:KilA-N domain-containing protein [ANME-2 cluster archaeon]MBC2702129.1 KilA-N domain-containing protein [ANME-2 cluster archaeon]MBC2708710.1 KilA-N domain-containing protein [ANME-2 cluster archaeon]MBC2745416.1 KilA-N domain-containing protein [ANME-2 cluster archaeon]